MSAGSSYDLAILGAGPGGYVAAIRAAQLGRKVAIIEQERPGGVCLNWGCIPSKALLTGAELVESLRAHGSSFGISVSGISLDYAKAIDHSRKVADRLCRGVESLLKKNQITLIAGRGRVAGPAFDRRLRGARDPGRGRAPARRHGLRRGRAAGGDARSGAHPHFA